ncbi:MAG: GGDEF domain-containing protein [Pseudomonadales bacterium]|nr:GGDEF domain-containing protein [Pseudomonadales bacterium]
MKEPQNQTEEVEFLKQREALTLLFQNTRTAVISHGIVVSLILFTLWEDVPHINLLLWWLVAVAVAIVRGVHASMVLRRMDEADAEDLRSSNFQLLLMTFAQTLIWGSAVVFIWPEAADARSFLVVILGGIIAAGAVMLSIHRQAFFFYALPIGVPMVIKLGLEGSRVETTLALLMIIFISLMFVTVNRLSRVFLAGLETRFRMQALSRTDPLTQLANRRYFDTFLDNSWQLSIRNIQPVGVLLIDVDYFKSYNDRYGHPQGDDALRQLAEVLTLAASRSTDMAARIGGEEFAIVLPVTDEEGARLVAEHIQAELAARGIVHEDNPTGLLTVSIGVNVIQALPESDRVRFIEAADQALYQAKAEGRNCIIFSQGENNV